MFSEQKSWAALDKHKKLAIKNSLPFFTRFILTEALSLNK